MSTPQIKGKRVAQTSQPESNFGFLKAQWPAIADQAHRAEFFAYRDARVSLMYARRALEQLVGWMYEYDATLKRPLKDDLNNRLNEFTFQKLVPVAVRDQMHAVRKIGNTAVHTQSPISVPAAAAGLTGLFRITVWIGHTYAENHASRVATGTSLDLERFRPTPAEPAQPSKTQPEVAKLAAELEAAGDEKEKLQSELDAARAELERIKAANAEQKIPELDLGGLDEAATRVYIDLQLREAGWDVDAPRAREFQVTGLPPGFGSKDGIGYADYVLWGRDGRPLAVLEAKKASASPKSGEEQARLYADALERQFGRRPVIYYSNGYEHWVWDDAAFGTVGAHRDGYPPRRILGFHTRDELELMIERRTGRKRLATAPVPAGIADRQYQQEAIRAVAETFDEHRRKALLVMATGTGKTRTVVALAKLLMEARWAKRVLFLADRNALVNQAKKVFGQLLSGYSPARLGIGHDDASSSRLHLATYPTMMNMIAASTEGRALGADWRGIGYYDLVIIDEAHRSVYQKYGRIFDYLDSYLVGLTATPRDEIDKNTYGLFELESGKPTSAYPLEQAIEEGYLVPYSVRNIELGFMRRGVKYDELSEEERAEWDTFEWSEDGDIPDSVDTSHLNKWLFNADTVDKVLEVLMSQGHRVSGGDVIGKTIVFARNQDHAEFIKERFDANYPQHSGDYARVITHSVNHNQMLIDSFAEPEKRPEIAISVDMLDTGIDVPDVVNLVFFKEVKSKTKFWQMVGRGTRLRPDLYGPGMHKKDFIIFDVCGNVDFFNAGGDAPETRLVHSLAARTFTTRARALVAAGRIGYDGAYIADLRDTLHGQVRRLERGNFLVRPHLAAVEKFSEGQAWDGLSDVDEVEAEQELSGLADTLPVQGSHEARRFDLLALSLQLAALTHDESAALKLGRQLSALAGALAERLHETSIGKHRQVIEAILDIEDTGVAWSGQDPAWLERVRTALRDLIPVLEKAKRKPVYSDFEDTLIGVSDGELTAPSLDIENYRLHIKAHLEKHLDHLVIQKLRRGRPLTDQDLETLESLVLEDGKVPASKLHELAGQDLASFIKSLVGLDRDAVRESFAEFVVGSILDTRQQQMLNMMVDHLTRNGRMTLDMLFSPPYTDIAQDPLVLFDEGTLYNFRTVMERFSGTKADDLAG
ncbi:DEAD/DEAH box helicase family protein [Zhihengliuella salsuginis]|uniref:Restriction endonuclease subunit R n=1 Tax=Zhihengliuella salsuginis TaxID=578222 RepID=A0ABQ3GJP3_9MICC|nr:DEAD/DEAH box helicase family protein [Zhihengliuella salsuginis]GHD07533.1 restriction endonuclease subunit R [Zhihengliuella salsuginis]